MSDLPRIVVITDRKQVRTTLENVVRDVCDEAGCSWILFRERDLPPLERREMAQRLRRMTAECNTKLSVSAGSARTAFTCSG